MTITPEDKDLLAELDRAIDIETKLLPLLMDRNKSTYDRDTPWVTLDYLRGKRQELLITLTDCRINVLSAAKRLTQ